MRKALAAAVCGLAMWAGAARAAEGEAAAEAGMWKKGIAYLLKTQGADGSWGEQRGKAGVTGIVLEALAAAPAEFRDDALAAACRKAADYIVAQQKSEKPYDGAIFEEGAAAVSGYCTSIAILALTRYDREKYLPVVAKAVDWLKRQQATEELGYDKDKNPNAYGGFAYGSGGDARGSRPDLSNSWMALDALKASGLVADDDPVWAKAKIFAQRCQHASEVNDQPWASDDPALAGSGVYVPATGRDGSAPNGYGSMSYALLLSYLWTDTKKDDPAVKAAVKWLADNYSVEKNPNASASGVQGRYYYFRVMARALSAYGDRVFAGHDWAKELAAHLVTLQREDGSFVNEADRWGESDPMLVTGYTLGALATAQKAMAEEK